MEALVSNITATCPLPFSGATGLLFARAIATVVTSHCAIFADYTWPKDQSQEILKTGPRSFDFIIAGAGTAGSSLAGTLAKLNPSWSVLLIEAGDDPSLNSEVPAFLIYNQDIDWKFETKTNDACLGFKNEQCSWNKGKVMGGSSSINAMLYIRGHPHDYNLWESMGNSGWGYADLKPHFLNIEQKFNLSSYRLNDNNLYNILEQAYKENGIQANNVIYEAREGTKVTKLLIHNGKRLNTAKVHLEESERLFVMKNAIVQKVNLDINSKTAVSVEVLHKTGKIINIAATKEVIISAGSVGTPQILMLSGIGPKHHLIENDIKCIVDLPVGKNLQDHLLVPIFFKTQQQTHLTSESIILSLLQYMLTRTGPLSNLGLTDFMTFINTKNDSDYPDIQFHHAYFYKNDKMMIRPYLEGFGYKDEIIKKIEQFNTNSDLLGIYPTLLHPKSRGEILLNDKDPSSKPVIKTNYFDDKDDLTVLLKAIESVKRLQSTEVFKSLGIEIIYFNFCDMFEHTNDYWECYIRHMATTIYHPVGTAKMGLNSDKSSVVDNELLVHGIKKLRVVDASIMPIIPGGNTMAPTLVIAEKALDIIKMQYLTKDEL